MQKLWGDIKNWLRPPPITDFATLEKFIVERASYMAQKCAVNYCRGKTGQASHTLFKEKVFIDALTVCRWESFVAILGDLLIALENYLRPKLPADIRGAATQQIAAMFGRALDGLPLPDYRPEGWAKEREEFLQRFAKACAAPVRPVPLIFQNSAQRLFDTLPIHPRMRAHDTEAVFGAVRFHSVGVFDELTTRARFDSILRSWPGIAPSSAA